MATFQKLLLVSIFLFGLSSLLLFNQFLKNQEQIKKDELEFQRTQQRISDCKYILSKGEDLVKEQSKIAGEAGVLYKVDPTESNRLFHKEELERFRRMLSDVVDSSKDCRDLLSRLGLF